MTEDEEHFMRRLKRRVTSDQITALAHAPDSYFERIASFIIPIANERFPNPRPPVSGKRAEEAASLQ